MEERGLQPAGHGAREDERGRANAPLPLRTAQTVQVHTATSASARHLARGGAHARDSNDTTKARGAAVAPQRRGGSASEGVALCEPHRAGRAHAGGESLS